MKNKKEKDNKAQRSKAGLIADVLQWVVIGVLVFTSAALVLSKFNTPLRFRVFSINSGSMSPGIRLGSMVIVVPRQNYQEGDVITFSSRLDPTQFTTHRIARRGEDVDLNRVIFNTKGDANEDEDITTVRKEQVVGKVLFSLPLLGYLIAFAKTQTGFVILVVIPATILVYGELQNLKKEITEAITERKSQKEKKEKEKKPKKAKKTKSTKKSKK